MNDPEYFRRDARDIRADQTRAQQIEVELLGLLERWEALEQRRRDGAR